MTLTHDTASCLIERLSSGSRPGSRTDGRKIALSIEGGAMRGVVSAGMVAALEQLGMLDCFDVVYGCSAGAISAAYFVAGQARTGTTIFYEDINNAKFIDLLRPLSGLPVVSLEYLLDDVCRTAKPLNTDAVLSSPIPLHVIASSASSGLSLDLTGFSDDADLFDALRGSATIPLFAGPPVRHRGDALLDGAILQPIPFVAIKEDKAITDVVVLMTRPEGLMRGSLNVFDRWLVEPYLRKLHQALGDAHHNRADLYRSEVLAVSDPRDASPSILRIQPSSSDRKVSSLSKDRAALVEGAKSGYRAVYAALGKTAPAVTEVLFPVSSTSLR